ncbi:MAG: methyltransferase domain-containing protein [Bacteroidota bacterium]
MDVSNRSMTIASINAMQLKTDDTVPEIGHGNCGHLPLILERANNINFKGLEVCETMYQLAQQQQQAFVTSGQATFYHYDGKKIPLSDHAVNKIMTINTVYFWEDPKTFLAEIQRVLKKEGLLVIAFAQKAFMQQILFVSEKFKLYDLTDIQRLNN